MSDSSDASFELLEGPPPRKKKPSSLPASRKRARRSFESNPEPKYKEESSESEFSGVSASGSSSDGGVVLVDSDDDDNDKKPAAKRQKSSIGNGKPPRSTNGAGDGDTKPIPVKKAAVKPIPVKKAAVKSPGAAGKSKMESAKPCEIRNKEGIDLVIPHTLLNKHKAPAKNECTLLVQMNDDKLDLHGQSGAVGRLEADERGVILDLKGYQYRGTIRPGPTAMVVALTREGKFKVESITDEFVTLDAKGAHVMDSLGDNMREGFMVREEDVNARKKGGEGEDDKEGTDGKGKMGRKRAAGKSSGSSAPQKRKKVKK
ncbi:hypothetical protein THAOC_34834 [Thalassiosira oceanica]|uniref:DNA-binding protein BIN4 n=1 Tax=Thalassiosira oceanica TaxID=159749 RepID=K0R1V7_THAOC|nr:hypothetical protein THAOC_34834 [Thalassiosira oceanica]|eukprot:EJK46493.1 hypothetical protein THAOC_34834 [Thalassiosira oceanica]